MENLNSKIKIVNELELQKEEKENKINELKAEIQDLDIKINDKKSELLSYMKENNLDTYKFDSENLVLSKFGKESIIYKNETEILKCLKENFDGKFVKTKTTESLDKTPFKKALKTDISLSEALGSYIEKSLTEYVVVTTSENYEKMLEHINESKK